MIHIYPTLVARRLQTQQISLVLWPKKSLSRNDCDCVRLRLSYTLANCILRLLLNYKLCARIRNVHWAMMLPTYTKGTALIAQRYPFSIFEIASQNTPQNKRDKVTKQHKIVNAHKQPIVERRVYDVVTYKLYAIFTASTSTDLAEFDAYQLYQ